MLITIPFTRQQACRYNIATDEMISGIWKHAVRIKPTGIRHAWVLVERKD